MVRHLFGSIDPSKRFSRVPEGCWKRYRSIRQADQITIDSMYTSRIIVSVADRRWFHNRRWFRKLTVRFRPIRKEIVSSMYNNFCCCLNSRGTMQYSRSKRNCSHEWKGGNTSAPLKFFNIIRLREMYNMDHNRTRGTCGKITNHSVLVFGACLQKFYSSNPRWPEFY